MNLQLYVRTTHCMLVAGSVDRILLSSTIHAFGSSGTEFILVLVVVVVAVVAVVVVAAVVVVVVVVVRSVQGKSPELPIIELSTDIFFLSPDTSRTNSRDLGNK